MKLPSQPNTILTRCGRGFVRIVSGAVDLAVLGAILLLLAYACFALWDSNQVYEAAGAAQYQIYKPQKDDSLSFDEWKQRNKDIIGWLTIYGTGVDYPLVQAADNDFYLTRDALKAHSTAGSIFLDYRNANDFSDFNTLIYGHNMAGSVMFGDIANYSDFDYFSKHKYGNLYYDGTDHGLEFFAFLEADAYDSTVYTPAITGEERQAALLKRLLQAAKQKTDTEVITSGHIVLLSTCTTDITNGRHILVGKILDDVFDDPYYVGTEAHMPQIKPVDRDPVWYGPKDWPIAVWIGISILGVLILIAVIDRCTPETRQQKKP